VTAIDLGAAALFLSAGLWALADVAATAIEIGSAQWRCWLFGHVPGAIVGRGDTLHVHCVRCLRLSPGIRITTR